METIRCTSVVDDLLRGCTAWSGGSVRGSTSVGPRRRAGYVREPSSMLRRMRRHGAVHDEIGTTSPRVHEVGRSEC
jgi:hypothetical protein